mgnify:CR=1 FL=1
MKQLAAIYVCGVFITAILLGTAIRADGGRFNDVGELIYFAGLCLLWPLTWACIVVVLLVVTIAHVNAGGTVEDVFTKPWW